ncbi:MAG: adenylate/guanylate cyclase domain-containing protein [Chromatiales bacterium]
MTTERLEPPIPDRAGARRRFASRIPPSGEARISREAFIATKRHDLRTPINAIIGYSEFLIEEAAGHGVADAIPDLERILQAGCSLLSKVNALLDASKIGLGEIDLSDMNALANRVHHTLRNDINSVIGYAEMLLEEWGEAHGAARADLRSILASARRLTELIDEIIAFARVMSGGAPAPATEAQSTALAAIVRTLRDLETRSPEPQDKPGRILVVDDDSMTRHIIVRRLAKEGHQCETAADGRQALDRLACETFDVVLLDILMPVMDGYQVLLHRARDERLRHIPVIVLSADDQIESIVRCIGIGADDFLPKPPNPFALAARLKSCLQRKRFRDREQAYLEEIHQEREHSERLLLNILPASIADRLKRGEESIADAFDDVTLLFADIVGFTPMAAAISAEELVWRLNAVFRRFDALVDKHGVEKVKTVGDAYMAVAGVPDPCPDHAQRMAELALDFLRAVRELNAELGLDIAVRVGINTGRVVAGVIGARKFAYDLWGDAVNTASRMESSGLPGTIHVAPASAALLRDQYCLRERGPIEIKGYGTLTTFFLEGRRSQGDAVCDDGANDPGPGVS